MRLSLKKQATNAYYQQKEADLERPVLNVYNFATFWRNKVLESEKVTRVAVDETGGELSTDGLEAGNHCM